MGVVLKSISRFFLCCPYFLVQFIFIVDKMLGSGLKSSYELYLVLSSPAQLLYIYHVIFTVLQAVACYNTNSGNKCGKLLIITILLKVQSGGRIFWCHFGMSLLSADL